MSAGTTTWPPGCDGAHFVAARRRTATLLVIFPSMAVTVGYHDPVQ